MATLLSATELTALRAEMTGLMPGTCVIQRFTATVGSAGFAAKAYAAVGTAICRVDPKSSEGRAGVVASQDALKIFRQLTVPWNTDLRADDRVVYDDRTYSVVRLDDDHALNAVVRAEIVKVDA